MKTFAAAIFFILFSFFPAAAQTENGGLRRLPVEIQSGIRWVDIKRSGREIKYTYIVNVNSAEWSDGERMAMMTRLQDFGCRQLLPAMCQGAQVMFASGLTATTTYHDSFGNYLFDCTFNEEICRPPEMPEE